MHIDSAKFGVLFDLSHLLKNIWTDSNERMGRSWFFQCCGLLGGSQRELSSARVQFPICSLWWSPSHVPCMTPSVFVYFLLCGSIKIPEKISLFSLQFWWLT
jgi:hypothetical protein